MKHCTTDKCPQILDSSCVFYEGTSLIFSGINTNDSVETVIQKLNLKLESIPVFNSNNYYTKQEVIDNFKPISYNPNIDEVLTNGNTTSHPIIIQNSFGGSNWENSVTSVGNYFKQTNIGSSEVEEILFGHEGITSSNSSGNTAIIFAPKTKTAYVIIPNESGTIVLDYQLNDYYKKTETFSQTEITNFLNNKQNNLVYTPENISNKSDSYTASSSTTYASSKALVDGLATKADLVDGKVPSSQLPSYVDDVLEFANLASFPATGESGKIYIAIDTNVTYRWSGTGYSEISASLALGETSSTAYRGDRGKIAFDHSQTTGNPHGTTKADIGLGNVNNTSDLDKPISTATQNALVDGLATKLEKSTYTGTASDLYLNYQNLLQSLQNEQSARNSADQGLENSKLDKPTVDGTWVIQKLGSIFTWVAYVAQNISNTDLSNVSARIFTQGNSFTWNTAGFPYLLKNLLNKSTDIGSNKYLSYNPTTGDVGFREFASVRTGTFNPPTLAQLATLGIIAGEFYKCTTTGQISIFNGELLDNWYCTVAEWNALSVAQKNAVKNFNII